MYNTEKKKKNLKGHDVKSAILDLMLFGEQRTFTLNSLKLNQTDEESHKYLQKVSFF